MEISEQVELLLEYATGQGILPDADVCFARNMLLSALALPAPEERPNASNGMIPQTATGILTVLVDAAVQQGVIEDYPFARDQLSAHLMNLVSSPPSQVIGRFETLRRAQNGQAATDWLYHFCRANDYIRVDLIAKNIAFTAPSPYGELDITINLSKPEKDPRDIARAKDMPAEGYPKCMLCIENEGYTGHPGYPSHESMRIVPITLGEEDWRFQYSPYSYYPEHCIALNAKHIPMAITQRTFVLLLDFVRQFPHYFIGSNADLPIVGGSILGHDHFQGGRHVFPMDKAPAYAFFRHTAYQDVQVAAVRWPMTCIRLSSKNAASLIAVSNEILDAWREYDDYSREIHHCTDGRSHNTITPIARLQDDGTYVMQLVLRNNRTTQEHPLGIFHPHEDLHHIKRENIGLIEVMGLFILPGRLRDELKSLTDYLTGKCPLTEKPADDSPLAKHYAWILEVAKSQAALPLTPNAAWQALEAAVGQKCQRVLEDAGVFKPTADGDAGLASFLESMGIMKA